jgi:hypothetical protein
MPWPGSDKLATRTTRVMSAPQRARSLIKIALFSDFNRQNQGVSSLWVQGFTPWNDEWISRSCPEKECERSKPCFYLSLLKLPPGNVPVSKPSRR